MAQTILEPGTTCWRLAKAGRAAVLIDGAAYFEAVASAIEDLNRNARNDY